MHRNCSQCLQCNDIVTFVVIIWSWPCCTDDCYYQTLQATTTFDLYEFLWSNIKLSIRLIRLLCGADGIVFGKDSFLTQHRLWVSVQGVFNIVISLICYAKITLESPWKLAKIFRFLKLWIFTYAFIHHKAQLYCNKLWWCYLNLWKLQLQDYFKSPDKT